LCRSLRTARRGAKHRTTCGTWGSSRQPPAPALCHPERSEGSPWGVGS
jgi:hypothetical protein